MFVVRRNVRFTAKPGSPEAKAVETTYSDSVLMAIPIKTMNPMKGTTVIDLNDIFFGDFAELGLGFLGPVADHLDQVKAFKKNVELQVAATYSGGRFGRMFFGGDDVIDSRGITVVVHYGLVELPDGGYQPRFADDRVGHFLTVQSRTSPRTPRTPPSSAMVNRWRLERADGTSFKEGDRPVPPKKQIIYWIENSVPDEYRTAVREGILEWNKAFEKVGFKNAIEVRQQEGEEFDPEDVTYATFRWITTDIPFAIGPSRANPLTGEILDADILFDAQLGPVLQAGVAAVPGREGPAGRAGEPDPGAARAGTCRCTRSRCAAARAAGTTSPASRRCRRRPGRGSGCHAAQHRVLPCAAHKRSELALAVLHIAAVAGLKAGEKVPEELIGQADQGSDHARGRPHPRAAAQLQGQHDAHERQAARHRHHAQEGLVGSGDGLQPGQHRPEGRQAGRLLHHHHRAVRLLGDRVRLQAAAPAAPRASATS